MFGRRKRDEQAAEAAREEERRALFAELAKRPDTVCPFLGLADARAGYRAEPNGEHRCYAFGDPAPLSDEQQRHVCLERGYSNCPRYLRGVLVIPSEELEALRRPQAPAAPPPPAPAPAPAARGRRRTPVLAVLLLVLVAAAGAGGWYLTNSAPGVAVASPTPSETPTTTPAATVSASASASASETQTAKPTPVPTPIVVPSSGVFPTPGPNDTPTGGYAVVVTKGTYVVFLLDDAGNVVQQTTANFDPKNPPFSAAPVDRIQGTDGRIYWKTLAGGYTGRSYTQGISGDFRIFAVYQDPQGGYTYRQLPASQL